MDSTEIAFCEIGPILEQLQFLHLLLVTAINTIIRKNDIFFVIITCNACESVWGIKIHSSLHCLDLHLVTKIAHVATAVVLSR